MNKTPFSKEDLEYFKKLLLQKRSEALDGVEEIKRTSRSNETQGSAEDSSAYSLHMAEAGTDAMEREKSLLFAQRGGDYIDSIDAALERIEAGTHGVCRTTGQAISRARLEAVPTATECIEAKLNREKKAT